MIENKHFLTRTLLVFPLLRLFLQQETFTPLCYFPPTLLLITGYMCPNDLLNENTNIRSFNDRYELMMYKHNILRHLVTSASNSESLRKEKAPISLRGPSAGTPTTQPKQQQ